MTTTFAAAALSFFALAPAYAQNAPAGATDEAVDAAEDAAEDAAAQVGEIAAVVVVGADAGPMAPQLTEFDLLQNKPADYPPTSWINGEEGTAYYELAVDADGSVTGCTIIESTGHERLDAKTCEIAMERGAFFPATDSEGSPIAGTHRDFQVWNRREPQFPGSATIHVRFTTTAQGAITDCDVVEVSGEIGDAMRDTMEREPCPGMSRLTRPPYRDEDGNPVAKRVDLMIVVQTEDVAE